MYFPLNSTVIDKFRGYYPDNPSHKPCKSARLKKYQKQTIPYGKIYFW